MRPKSAGITRNQNKSLSYENEEKLNKLKKEVDSIRKKYNLNQKSKLKLDFNQIKNSRLSTADVTENNSFSFK